jgi:glutaredoxin 3
MFRLSFALTAALSCLLVLSGEAFQRPNLARKSPPTQLHLFGFLNDGKNALVKSLAGDYDQAAVQARIQGLIGDNSVFMFSQSSCPFCVKAKSVLGGMGAKYTVVELDTDPDGKAIRAEMADLVGRTSVPAIWIGGQFVGGCNDGPMGGLMKLDDSGELKGMLQGVGAL